MITSPAFAGKRYAVLGLARSGLATVQALHASGAEVTAWDINEGPREQAQGMAVLADPLEIDLTGFAGVVVSPGVPLNRHPIRARAANAGVPVIGDIELFAQARASLPSHKVVGITGTNGKSTTTALVHHILCEAGVPTLMGGNIGLPILSQTPLASGGVYVLELSSYQIDLSYSLDCDVAALTNVTPDHLDRYADFAAYAAAKQRLFAMQSQLHHTVFTDADDYSRLYRAAAEISHGAGHVRVAQVDKLTGQQDWPSLQGPHNGQNAAIAIAIVEALGISEAVWRPALASFQGLPHRMERVAEINGVLFVNDSKATNPASTAPALAAFPRVHWIVGGLAKTDTLDDCADNFSHVVRAYTIGEAGQHYGAQLAEHMPVEDCEMLLPAVRSAAAHALPGDVVMLSPACASFDQFKDYEARGECFRFAVQSLQPADVGAVRG